MTIRRAVITLYVDPDAYRDETGHELTEERLQEIGRDINEETASLYGYESWEAEFKEITPTNPDFNGGSA